MLTQLSTLKARLGITDNTYDALLTSAITAVSARFDRETNRILARTVNATHEFSPFDTELLVPCYPIETVTKFELKFTESEGWLEQPDVHYLVRRSCTISLSSGLCPLSSVLSLARVTYTGGYVLPGTAPASGQTSLPADIEQAAVEQTAHWFQTRDYLGLKTHWPSGGIYLQFTQEPLLPAVAATLKQYERWRL
jgi:Phage gp6-like head-tail connector protein